jgi:hypothetical protein
VDSFGILFWGSGGKHSLVIISSTLWLCPMFLITMKAFIYFGFAFDHELAMQDLESYDPWNHVEYLTYMSRVGRRERVNREYTKNVNNFSVSEKTGL